MKTIFLSLSILFLCIAGASGQDLRVMSYNIRFNNPKDGPNAWPERKAFLLSQIQFTEADFIGTQEGLLEQITFLDQSMPDFEYIGVGRDDGKKAGEFSALFYNKRKYKLLNNGTFWLSPTPDKPSKGWDAALNRVCTYGQFKGKKGKKFWVFNTHFDHRGVEARIESVDVILQQIKKLNTKGEAIILMGDFNLPPESEAITKLVNTLNDTYTSSINPPLGPDGTFNGFSWTNAINRRIDYIFVSPFISVEKVAILTDSKDQRYPSDHFPVVAKLSW